MIKLSLNDFIKLYKLASVGKLIGGLIHNINGPMQNLGLDIEMTYFTLKDESKWDKDISKNIMTRLNRMEEEYEKVISLIRGIAERTQDNDIADSTISNIYEFLKQEFAYLHTNLYFKHNVQTEIINLNTPPLISSLPKDSLMALGWFLQSLVEELERQKVVGLTVKIIPDNSKLKILFSTEGGRLSEGFMRQFDNAMSFTDTFKSDNMDPGIFLISLIFKSDGVTLEFNDDSLSSNLMINFS